MKILRTAVTFTALESVHECTCAVILSIMSVLSKCSREKKCKRREVGILRFIIRCFNDVSDYYYYYYTYYPISNFDYSQISYQCVLA